MPKLVSLDAAADAIIKPIRKINDNSKKKMLVKKAYCVGSSRTPIVPRPENLCISLS